ncbi:hypothetical protein MMC10_011405, partial [Thelotrema lepadinum]|nr:hypothetical protein [Thelotrema lepadinum]
MSQQPTQGGQTPTITRFNYACPYHGPLLRLQATGQQAPTGPDPMRRFIAGGPAEQPALFLRA